MASPTDADRDLGVPPTRKPPTPPQSGGAVYGLGMIGALVWFWRRADGPAGKAVAVAKAMVWPAFLVHDAFEALSRRSD
ncbi:MAG: hypothetical protein R2726_03345 [Acidimicrobiales bacterium]